MNSNLKPLRVQIERLVVFLPLALCVIAVLFYPFEQSDAKDGSISRTLQEVKVAVGKAAAGVPSGSSVQAAGCGRRGRAVRMHGPRDRRLVALTFDDGPGPSTEAVLAILKRRRVPATFFVVGQMADRAPWLVRQMVAAGYPVGNHSYDHHLPNRSTGEVNQDIDFATASIVSAVGFKPCIYRAPYGAVNQKLTHKLAQTEMTNVLWDVDTEDWKYPLTSQTISRAVTPVRPGSIVLMHELPSTVKALPTVIAGLKKRHFKFVTVTELLKLNDSY